MVDFRKSLTQFSRNTNEANEHHMKKKYDALQRSYERYSNTENPIDDKERFNRPYLHITISFYLLVAGICLSFLSTIGCF
jgi:hypothetical protein